MAKNTNVVISFKTATLLYCWAIINTNRSPYKQQTGEESVSLLTNFSGCFLEINS